MFTRPAPAAAFLAASLAGGGSLAQTAPSASSPAPSAAIPPAPSNSSSPTPFTIGGVQLNAQFDAGATFNPWTPDDGINFGHLFTDRANQPVLNQALLTAQRPIDPKSKTLDLGFDFQILFGTDARYYHILGEFNHLSSSNYQLTIINANLQAHLPYLTSGGVDLKVGQYPAPIGFEALDPSQNPFYSHSYIFNFGVPTGLTGGYAVAHVSDALDLYVGGDSGNGTAFAGADNNSAPAAMGGFNLTLMGGNLTVLAMTHIGPENPTSYVPGADGFMRSYNDAVITYKASPKLTLTTELDWARDAFGVNGSPANGLGVAQYASYALTDQLTLNGRAELFRDDNGFFVTGFTSPLAAVKSLGGVVPFPRGVVSSGPNTYTELTIGMTYKPPVPTPIANLALRPEIRWDHSYENPAFNDFRNANAVTIGGDLILGF